MTTASLAHPGALGAARDAREDALTGTPDGVHIEHLTVRFGARAVLDDLSLTIERGELLTVLGKSGCGKTTLLRFIAGFIETEGLAGTLIVAGRDLTHVPPHKRNLGLLFQSYAL
ncbi:MAG TPA: ATP-binding cassette domain-containing protein, partial [Trinickia sp.]|nr:ATP-binding cassette domain-containing protein [Trinickia sp.]